MHDKTDKSRKAPIRGRRIRKHPDKSKNAASLSVAPPGFDPELLYVECARCGAPVVWEPGRASKLLKAAGVDPVELDASCMLVTDCCPACGGGDEFQVRIFRISDQPTSALPPSHGHA